MPNIWPEDEDDSRYDDEYGPESFGNADYSDDLWDDDRWFDYSDYDDPWDCRDQC